MSSSVLLSQDSNSSLSGVNLKWAYTALGAIDEISLIYFKNASDADIVSKELPSGVLKHNIASGFESGQSYSFQLQVTDVTGLVVYSNALVLTAPYALVAPVIASFVGVDAGLNIQLQASANSLTSSSATVEFVLKRADNTVFWIVKPFASSGAYSLSSADSALLLNNQSYRVACMFQPSADNTLYSAPSGMSNSITATPSNVPNIPGSVTVSSTGTTTMNLRVDWTRPSDYTEWSQSEFTVEIKYLSSIGDEGSHTSLYDSSPTYTFTNLPAGVTYTAQVRYVNAFGAGPWQSAAGYILLTHRPDAPVLDSVVPSDQSAVLSWTAPAFSGQSSITGYIIYRNANVLADNVTGLTYTDLTVSNGVSYSYVVYAKNAIGSSVGSNAIIMARCPLSAWWLPARP